jgi:polyphosphate kinase
VQAFLEQVAAADPDVLATGATSIAPQACSPHCRGGLVPAAEAGKQASARWDRAARFDESANTPLARK